MISYDKSHPLYKHLHICLVEDHFNPLGIVRSLGEAGIMPIVLLCTTRPKLVHYSRYAKKVFKFDSIEKAFCFMIMKFGNELLKPFVYNGSDNIALILDSHYEELKDRFIFCNAKGTLKHYLLKYNITMLAKKCGCFIPNEELLNVGEMPKHLSYPVLTKAATSSKGGNWKAETFICKTERELREAYKHISSSKILVQEYIEKNNELNIEGLSINGGDAVILPCAAKYFRFSSKSYGTYMYFDRIRDKTIVDSVKKIISKCGYSGIFDVEFLISKDNKPYFLEVNFRNDAWSYACTYAGFNLPYIWARSTLDGRFDILEEQVPDFNITAMSDFEDFRLCVKERGMHFFRWLKDFMKADCKFVYNHRDPIPFFIVVSKMVVKKSYMMLFHKGVKKK